MQTKWIYNLCWEICGGLFVYFFADCVVNFAKKLQTGEKSHSDPVTRSNVVKNSKYCEKGIWFRFVLYLYWFVSAFIRSAKCLYY